MEVSKRLSWYFLWCGLGVLQGVLSSVVRLGWFEVLFSAYGSGELAIWFVLEVACGFLTGLIVAASANDIAEALQEGRQRSWLMLGSLLMGLVLYNAAVLFGYQSPFGLIAFPGVAEIATAVLSIPLAYRLAKRDSKSVIQLTSSVGLIGFVLIGLAVMIGQPPRKELDGVVANINREIQLLEIPCPQTSSLSSFDGRCFTFEIKSGARGIAFKIRKAFEISVQKRYKLANIRGYDNQHLWQYIDAAEHWKLIVMVGDYPAMLHENISPSTEHLGYLRILYRRIEVLNPSL
jgi:hypothetical protein